MPGAMVMRAAVNDYIVSNPTAALEVTGALVAAGVAGVTLRQIMRVVGLKESELPQGAMAEAELLDEQAPASFFGRAVSSVHASLVGWKMRSDLAPPMVDWRHGRWTVHHRIGGMSLPIEQTELVRGFEITEVKTPLMNQDGELV
jgi:hypothetical protein